MNGQELDKQTHASLSDRDILLLIWSELRTMNGRVGDLERCRAWAKGWLTAMSVYTGLLGLVVALKALNIF